MIISSTMTVRIQTVITIIGLTAILGIFSSISRADDPAKPEPAIRKHWFVTGRVQGVSFRAFTYESATDLKLTGWVRNLTDGRVEIVAEGPEKATTQLLEKVKRGPAAAHVESVREAKPDHNEKLADHFEIRDSATPPPP